METKRSSKSNRSKSFKKKEGTSLTIRREKSRTASLKKKAATAVKKLDKSIKIILIISGHGLCETIKCNGNICSIEKEECIFDNNESVLHDCEKATGEFHMSVYTEDIKLYSYAPYSFKNWSRNLKILTDKEGEIFYYNDFSRIYNVNRQIEATIKAINSKNYNNFEMIMESVKEQINDPAYIGTFKTVNKNCEDIEKLMIKFDNKSIVKEVYQFNNEFRSDNPILIELKKPEREEYTMTSLFWALLGYHKYIESTSQIPHDDFSGIFVAFTNNPSNFGLAKDLLPKPDNPIYNCDFTLFSHIVKIGGIPLCKLILNYINYWNRYIAIGRFDPCQKKFNTIILNGINNDYYDDKKILGDTIFYDEDTVQRLEARITLINNESLYHIVNIILNFNKEGSPLIAALQRFFSVVKIDDINFTNNFQELLKNICGLFNVELHLISNACRSTDNSIIDQSMEEEIIKLQGQCMRSSRNSIGGRKTKKRRRRPRRHHRRMKTTSKRTTSKRKMLHIKA
jgi:hypothetical protein